MGVVAPAIVNPITVWCVVGFLALWAGASAFRFSLGTFRLDRALVQAQERLAQANSPLKFAADFESIRVDLCASPILGERWREFCETLVLPDKPGRPVRSTWRASDYFNLLLFRMPGVGIDLRYQAALPNLLVGAGLLFTFLGLAAALYSAGNVVSGDPIARSVALKALLDAASFKFITSLVGLLLSILYALARKRLLKRVDRSLDLFNATLEARAPMVTPALLLHETNLFLERQSTQLETFSNQLAVNIGEVFDRAFDQRLGEHIAPLTEAMQHLAKDMSSRHEDALKTMLDGFVAKLQGGAGDHMTKVAESLGGLGERLEGLQSGLGEAAIRMSQSADAMATRMGDGAEAALSRITDQLGGLAESLRATAEQTRSAGADAGRELASRLEAAAGGFERAASGIADTLSRAASALADSMGKQSEENSSRLAAQVEAMAERIATSASGFEQMATRVATALETAASATGGALGKGAEDAVVRIAAATEGMRTELQAMLSEFRTTLGRATEDLRAGGAAGAASFRDGIGEAGTNLASSIAGAADRLAQAGNTTAGALERGGVAAGETIGRAGNTFGDRAAALGAQVERVTQATQSVVTQMRDFEKAVSVAAGPLAAVSADLKAASQAARGSVDPILQSSQAVARALDQIAGATQRLEVAGTSAGRLVESLNGAAQRFEGVDRELAKTLDTLKGGLQTFTRDISDAVENTDLNLAKAANQLSALIRGLNDAIEDCPAAKGYAAGGR
jgi:ABC-type transporter Mla subunit MlaD